MDDYWPTVIGRQFAAAIQLARSSIEACPDELWDDRTDGSPFWHLAYHMLFFTDLYLTDHLESFRPESFHRAKAHFLPGDYGEPPTDPGLRAIELGGVVTTPDSAFTRKQLLDYADRCLRKCDETFKGLTDERALERCGIWWYELSVGEFLLHNLRHAQHHTGQLILILRRRADIGIEWLGTKDNRPAAPTW